MDNKNIVELTTRVKLKNISNHDHKHNSNDNNDK